LWDASPTGSDVEKLGTSDAAECRMAVMVIKWPSLKTVDFTGTETLLSAPGVEPEMSLPEDERLELATVDEEEISVGHNDVIVREPGGSADDAPAEEEGGDGNDVGLGDVQ
jgi:hypothetical protein